MDFHDGASTGYREAISFKKRRVKITRQTGICPNKMTLGNDVGIIA